MPKDMHSRDSELKLVKDSVPQIDNAVAVGENLEFQRKWWRFERMAWTFFALLIVCDVTGLFGRGPLAKAKKSSESGALTLNYERIERTSTPSSMIFHFGPAAVHNGRIDLFMSQSVVKDLGAQRIAPQPAISALGDGGLTYSFPVKGGSGIVDVGLEPVVPGIYHFSAGIAGEKPIQARVVVMP